MKNINARIILIVAIALVCISYVVYRMPFVASESAQYDSRTMSDEQRATNTDWPMFHGSQGLLGRASGTLPDKPQLIWRFKTAGSVKSSPAIVNGRVFVGSSDANLYAIDIKNGSKVWSYKTSDAIEAAPLVVDGVVYIGSLDGFLYAVDANSGSFKWKYETAGQISGAANWIKSPDNLGKDRLCIIVGSYDNKLHCVDANTGKALWTYRSDNYINGSPAVDANCAVFGGCDAIIHIVNLTDGKNLGKIESGSYIAASAAIETGQVYCGNYGNIFLRADIETRKIVWEFTQAKQPFFSSPALSEKVVVVGSRDEHIYCLDRNNGNLVWKYRTLNEVDSSPVIVDNKVVACSKDGRIYILSLADGKMLWSYPIGQAIISSPAVAQSVIVVGCDDGYVYAFAARKM
jgi:eukaryotic-like serine/threonine-protein kinase